VGKQRTGNIQRRGEHSWRLRYLNNDGIRQHETIQGTREDAEREMRIRLGEIAKGLPVSSKPNTVLFEELAADVITDYKVNKYSSLPDIEARLRLHILPVFGKRKAAQITTAMIKQYIVMRQSEDPPAATGSINRELEAMRHTFRLAMNGRKLLVMPHIPMLKENNVRSGFFTRAEVDRLCAQLKEPLASMVRFAFITGWRLEEVRSLEWPSVDFARGEIRLAAGTTKNRDGRVFPMTTELRALLAELETRAKKAMKERAGETVQQFSALTGRVFAGVGEFRKTWKTACYKAGLPCVVKPIIIRGHAQFNKDGSPKVRVIKSTRIFHDLRRSAIREWIKNGMPEKHAMMLSGHKTRSVLDRYNIVGESDLREAVRYMEQMPRESVLGHASGPTKTGKSDAGCNEQR